MVDREMCLYGNASVWKRCKRMSAPINACVRKRVEGLELMKKKTSLGKALYMIVNVPMDPEGAAEPR